MVNGALDSFLKGTGVYGAGISTIKNTLIQWDIQKNKPYGRSDDAKVVIEAISMSPPIGSKIRKINNAIKTFKYNEGVGAELGLRIENPNFSAWGNLIEAGTNIPLARIINKANNIEEAITGNHELWQRIALVLGWNKWSMEIEDEELEQAKSRAKQKRAEEKKKLKEQEKLEEQKAEEERKKKEGIKDIRCSGIKSDGTRCSIVIETKKDKAFCTHHKTYNEKEGSDRDNDGVKEFRCTGLKKDGTRCKNRTENKNKKCYAHQ